MKNPNRIIVIAVVVGVLALPTLGIVNNILTKSRQPGIWRSLLTPTLATAKSSPAGHFLIYLDVNACLSCTEDMAAWQKLEEKLSQCGYSFSLYAPKADSIDVAHAMALEGLNTPVEVLNQETIDKLGWSEKRTPIKALLDKNFELIDIAYAMGNRAQSRQSIEQIISKVCK